MELRGRALDRRAFLRLGALAAAGHALAPALRASAPALPDADRSISIRNARTGETASVTYWRDGRLMPSSLEIIRHILRDNHSDRSRDIDLQLVDLLYLLSSRLELTAPLLVVSGYRTPETNAWLARVGIEAAPNSLHMYGRAADLRVPGVRLPDLWAAAVSLEAGGVGYYPVGDFLHVDVGPVRRWSGSSAGVIDVSSLAVPGQAASKPASRP